MKITHVSSLEILDSRGLPTVRTAVTLDDGTVGTASVPSGASTGTHEAHELRDKDPKRFMGKGVLNAVHNVETEIATAVIGLDPRDQRALDEKIITLDATANKERLGANAILSVSLAAATAAALGSHVPLYRYLMQFFETTDIVLPVPLINVINGGKHATGSTDIQEYMLIPHGLPNFSEALRASAEIFQTLKKMLAGKNEPTTVGDEGGYAPHFSSNEAPLQLLTEAITETGYVPHEEFLLGMDSAASEFYTDGTYHFQTTNETLSAHELQQYYSQLGKKYSLASVEDPFAEDDWESYQTFTHNNPSLQVVGDDLYVTNKERLGRGISEKSTNAILIKLNQIGTLTETIDVMRLARENNIASIVSHRSGETEDTFIADLVVASGAGQIKTGSMSRSERLAKYNRLLEIEKAEKSARYSSFPHHA